MTHAPLYIDNADLVRQFVSGLAHVQEIAIDTEGASFHRFVDRVYLLQASTRSETVILDPLALDPPPELGRLMEDPNVEVVFHDADYDLRLLHQDYGWNVRNIFDTRIAAQLAGIRAFGLAALLERFFGVKLDKRHQRADWSMRPLTSDMLAYAAQDTMYLLDLRDRLRSELERLGRLGWAREEFTRLEGTRWDPEDAGMGFMRLKGARDLSRRELALLRELVTWRDGVAKELDRATFRVAGNETLLEAARRAPQTRDELLAIKGMPRGMADSRGAEIVAAVKRGLAVPDADLPRFPRPPRWDRDPDFDDRVARLKGVRDRHAAELDLDPGVLCSRERLESVARRKPGSIEELSGMSELRRWQVELMGKDLLRALREFEGSRPARRKDDVPERAEDSADSAGSPYRD